MISVDELTPRQHEILRLVVQEYVGAGRAVASQTLIERYPLRVSSATVRNEMAVLERLGLIEQLHTSAGRVPTDRGYRYYVEHFATQSSLPANEQLMIRHQFRQVETQLESWLELAASVLAGTARNVSLVTAPRTTRPRLRHFELLQLQDRVALLIMVTQDSAVHQAMLHMPEDHTQTELGLLADVLNARLSGLAAEDVRTHLFLLTASEQVVALQIAQALESLQHSERTDVHYEGIEHALHQPEFAESDLIQGLLQLMRGGQLLTELLPQMRSDDGMQIFIGAENESAGLRPFALVVSTYGVGDQVTGLLGILGPRRMPYGRSISSVRYMARLMSDLMHDLYAN